MEQFMMLLAECTITMTMAAAILLAVTQLLKNVNPKGVYIAWIVIVVGFLIPYRPHLVTPLLEITIRQPSTAVAMGGNAVATGGLPAPTVGEAGAVAAPLSLVQVLFLVWLAGMAVALVWNLIRHRRFMQVVKRWSRAISKPAVLEAFGKAKEKLGVQKEIGLLCCEPMDSPVLVGIVRPRILLPDLNLTEDELEVVFLHELTHYKRKDLLVKVLMLAAGVLHWFNPMVYVVSKTLAFYSEASCDYEVTKNEDMNGRQYYSETIISVIRRQSKMKTALSTSFYGGKNGMKRRILSIMNTAKKRIGIVAVCVALVAVLATGMALAVDVPPAGAIDTTGKNDAYKTLARISELDYEGMTAAEFADEVEETSREAGSDVFSLMSEADIDYLNGDPLYPFITGVLAHTSQEIFAAEIGDPETPFLTGQARKLREEEIEDQRGDMSDEEFEAFLAEMKRFEDAGFDTTTYAFQAYIFYTLLYDIPYANGITVGEREQRISSIARDVQAYVDGLSEEDMMAGDAKEGLVAELERLAEKYSDSKISFEYDNCTLEAADGETELFE